MGTRLSCRKAWTMSATIPRVQAKDAPATYNPTHGMASARLFKGVTRADYGVPSPMTCTANATVRSDVTFGLVLTQCFDLLVRVEVGETMENCKKYGVPFYGASFVPQNALKLSDTDAKKEDEEGSGSGSNYVIFSGGGGEGRSGILNALVISSFDSATNSLSDQP
ncbi:hypothetical protein Tco_0216602, partial [Tanacetum coccineum]